MAPKLRVAFLHPDLGIGKWTLASRGAERLVVDAAVGLQTAGHEVTVYTSHHDTSHCFRETRDGTLNVQVLGNTIVPRTLGGRFHILCAILRGWHLVLQLLLHHHHAYDVIVCDALSAYIPPLRLMHQPRILFYCHFPDKYLAKPSPHFLRKCYRVPFDALEEWATGLADCVVVNSKFTASIFQKAFSSIAREPAVLYPGIHLPSYDQAVDASDPAVVKLHTDHPFLLSINRFERKKAIGLAILTLARLRVLMPSTFLQLFVTGGYDSRVKENVAYLAELRALCDQLDLESLTVWANESTDPSLLNSARVVFVPSFSENQRSYLLRHAKCLLYTPSNEHFGIVPVEAMYARVPVIAVNSGGPMETIVDGATGFLCEPNPDTFAMPVYDLLMGKVDRAELGANGRDRVQTHFSMDAFMATLNTLVAELAQQSAQPCSLGLWLCVLGMACAFGYGTWAVL
ncbi:Alpha-1,3-mannosyltransferase-like protein [Dimargaris verticillata]|uniref:Alpha-1,3/1,6-mannosyltransferase ALG2 n=1 Tax=Dimargaris verticillata TaxID=2761393 RepID=A0A9W8BBJ8_9FUNG|nr:Alpha-1,3-mannosyltransferase-like protein [Dimargaris verticillata]